MDEQKFRKNTIDQLKERIEDTYGKLYKILPPHKIKELTEVSVKADELFDMLKFHTKAHGLGMTLLSFLASYSDNDVDDIKKIKESTKDLVEERGNIISGFEYTMMNLKNNSEKAETIIMEKLKFFEE